MLSCESADFLRDDKSTNRSISFLNHLKKNSGLWNSPDIITITAFLQCHSNHRKQYYLGIFQATFSNVKLLPSTILTSRFSFERNYLMSKLFSTHLFSLINAAHLHQSSDLSYKPPGLQFCVFLMRFLLPSVK